MTARHRILVLAFDPVTDLMPGPAIRAWHLAEQLAGHHEVVLAGTAGATRRHPAMDVRPVEGPELAGLADWADAVVGPPSVATRHPEVAGSDRPLCVDMYIPTHLENLEASDGAGSAEHFAAVAHQAAVIDRDLRRGDSFLCASERQRDFWLGALASLGRINPATYGADPTLRRLIDVVPFGLDPAPVVEEPGILRRAFPAIGPSDPVLIWGGGVYNWFDPETVVRAVDRLRRHRPAVRLVFLGMRHPNPGIPEMRVARRLREESERRGLTGTHVFFNEEWVPYDRRGAFLADADIAVSTHLDHVETRFSFRTRILDYLWAGLPMVLTGGDTLSDEIGGAGLGVAVAPGDDAAVADAVDRMLADPPDRERVREFGRRWSWDRVSVPLLRWAEDPQPAADRVGGEPGAEPGAESPTGPTGEPADRPPPLPPLGAELRALVGRRLPPEARRALSSLRRAGRRG